VGRKGLPRFHVTAPQAPDEPLTFEVGASGVMGNPLFQAFDRAVRGLRVGDTAVVKAMGGEYDKELLFAVPRGHEEVSRLEAEHAASGGLREGAQRVAAVWRVVLRSAEKGGCARVCAGLVVQLQNGQAAVLRKVADEAVRGHAAAGACALTHLPY
jgi:hypothetical protein